MSELALGLLIRMLKLIIISKITHSLLFARRFGGIASTLIRMTRQVALEG